MDKVDVFHVHGIWKPLYPTIGLLLSQHFHRPLVITLHGDSVDPNNSFAMHLNEPAIANVLKHANCITTFSKETYAVLQEIGLKKNSKLIPNFVDYQSFKRPYENTSCSRSKILMVSRLSKAKDPLTAIRAFAIVVKEIPDATFKIVGYGPLYGAAKNLIQELNLGENVSLLGMHSDVRKFLWDSDIFIATRGSYMATLEAWAAGLVVVAPGFGIMNEIISNEKNGLLVPPGDASQLASTLIKLINNKKLQMSLAKNGLVTSKKCDITEVTELIYKIYQTVV